jgi:hypothetical protein
VTVPTRVQLRRTKGWRKPENTVVVSRPSGWGNPFRIGDPFRFVDAAGEWCVGVVPGRVGAVRLFEQFLAAKPELREKIRRELAGKNLACWCQLEEPCHADVLLDLANREAS